MMFLCFLIICLFGSLEASAGGINDTFLSRSIYVPDHDVLGLISESIFSNSKIYKPLPSFCFHETPVHQSHKYFTFYRDTASFYSSIARSANLGASLESDFSLQTTLKFQSKNVAGSNNAVSGNELVIIAKSTSFAVEKSCLVQHEAFTNEFLLDLRRLPTEIRSPWLQSSWRLYETFQSKYGSHVLTQVTTGSEIDQRSFAKFSESYTERDFQVKSCLGLAGPVPIGKLGIDICGNITEEEKNRVSKLEMTTTLTVNGGTEETRNRLLTNRTEELIEQFLNEANTTKTPIRYRLDPIWNIIKQSYIGSSDDFIRGVNMESYYLGFLNYGCPFQTSGGQILQQFNTTASSTPENPDYECTLAPEGCHSDHDCHYQFGIWCGCEGDSCVRYNHTTLDTGKIKTTAYINHEKWDWKGCTWKHTGFTCKCGDERTERRKVWPGDASQNEILYHAHNQMMLKYNLQTQDQGGVKNREDL
ncbi:DELTA-alicitoxin-Pse2b-like [Dendronephthya gigantea]|uniref:DELTA-alicitoxin-Pse2b-like n=1 Tax=Dendronephthya gigantea TaxID=151771 RepID=UPI00106D2927|nr:DELTA-alicitoxin-Pse2b-like [Dendronephthya gigantea]